MTRQSIHHHEGSKYLKRIHPASVASVYEDNSIDVDVYCVLEAFNVECQATGHAIKKLLCAGQRKKGNRLEDLMGAMAALNRAIDLQEGIESRQVKSVPTGKASNPNSISSVVKRKGIVK